MANAIAAVSSLYEDLLIAYENEDKRSRFSTCYELADNAEYREIHFVISMLKEVELNDDAENILPDSFKTLLSAVKTLLASKENRRRVFLLDILEEARERKRP